MELNVCHVGDCRALLTQMAAAGVRAQTCVTSPPYFGLRDYGVDGQLGLEQTPEEYVAQMVEVFRGVRDVLADDGTLWLNLGDSYNVAKGNPGPNSADAKQPARRGWTRPQDWGLDGYKRKDLIGIPWMVAFALRADGWYLRSDIIWHKPNPMPESVTDRPTKAHEYIFLLSKRERYFYDAEAIREPDLGTDHRRSVLHKPEPSGGIMSPHAGIRKAEGRNGQGRNKRSVWTVTTMPFDGAHFAVFPRALIEPCILAGSRPGDVVLDPFMGSGTTAQVAEHLGRQWIGCELNPAYLPLQAQRLAQRAMAF